MLAESVEPLQESHQVAVNFITSQITHALLNVLEVVAAEPSSILFL